MIDFADLHIHTHYSDGTLSCREVIEKAKKKGIKCIAISDHDTFQGIDSAIKIALEFDMEIIAGIELSSELNGKDVHILGYMFDYHSKDFSDRLIAMQDTRVDRMEKMIFKLKELGINNIELEEVCALTKSQSVGRPHLAAILEKKGWVKDMREAFNLYIAEGAPAYVAKFKQTPQEAINLINEFGGASVLAHPMITNIDEMIPSLVEAGLDGLEAFYPDIPLNVINYYKRIAKKHNLLLTGGSDSHGKARGHAKIGRIKLPYEYVEALKSRVSQKLPSHG